MANLYKITGYLVDGFDDLNCDITKDILEGFERMYSRFSGVHSPVELKIEKSPDFVWSDDHPLNLTSCTAEVCERYLNNTIDEKCNSFEIRTREVPRYNVYTGQIDHYVTERYSICLGTKECDECSCDGFKRKCTFYPEKRKQFGGK